MDDASGNNGSKIPTDWELLSMSMTGSSAAELKSAVDAGAGSGAAPPSSDSSSGVADLTLHSQYFGQGGEIFPQSGDEAKADAAAAAVAAKAEEISSGTAEIEQQILVSSLSPRAGGAANESVVEFGDPPAKNEEVLAPEIATAGAKAPFPATAKEKSAIVVRGGGGGGGGKEWIKRRFQAVAKKVNRSSTLWSIAFVATVTGLFIIGKRWYHERLKGLELDMETLCADEKINDVAGELPEFSEETQAGTEAVSEPGTLFGILRELW